MVIVDPLAPKVWVGNICRYVYDYHYHSNTIYITRNTHFKKQHQTTNCHTNLYLSMTKPTPVIMTPTLQLILKRTQIRMNL